MSRRLSLVTREPLGWFHAVATRDAAGLARDRHPFFAATLMPESAPTGEPGDLFEVLFADGVWMLARTGDLSFAD